RSKNLIVVNIETLYWIFGYDVFKDRCSKLIMTFKSASDFYDIRDVKGSEIKIKEFASKIQLALGIEEYNIELPKLRMLGYSEMFSVGITIIFVFVSIIGMLISGILINGILNTSVEEKIREFGIFRVLGAYKNYNLAIVIIQGFLMCNIGTILGMIEAYFITDIFLLPFAENVLSSGFGLGNAGVEFAFNIVSVLIAYCLGIGVGLAVSIAPAIKVRRLQLIESIHPYRHEDTLYHLQKKSTINYKLILVGLILAGNGGFVYFIIPRLIITGDASLLAGTLLTILLIFNIGMTLAGMGLVPVILRLVLLIFQPISKKLHSVVRIFVFRYHRRNTSTVIIFAMSFSFVIFTATILQTLSAQFTLNVRLRYGSDLVIETTGWETAQRSGQGGFGFFSTQGPFQESGEKEFLGNSEINPLAEEETYSIDPSRIMTVDFKTTLLQIEGVETVSSVPATPFHLSQIYSQVGKEFSVEFGDYAGLTTQSISLYGIDEEYLTAIDTQYIKFTRGDRDDAFRQLFIEQETPACIISEAIGQSLNLNLGDKVRLIVERGDETENYPFIIVGMASSMPGFSGRFSGSSNAAHNGGVLISQDLYLKLLDIPANVHVEKFFIKLNENAAKNSRQIEVFIEDTYKYYYDFRVINLDRQIRMNEQTFSTLDSIFSIILYATVVICLFGLLSSSYSSIIERKKEIGIVRTLGLRGSDVNRLFILEAIIIMTSSSIIGLITGWLTAWLLASNLNLLSDTPTDIVFPYMNVIIVYILSMLSVFIGMKVLLRRARTDKIVDIYRESL
ncbi:MAG: ABC transporter permease, partial [Promethearchaeota archaeon]